MNSLAVILLDSANAVLVLTLVSLGLAVIFGLMNVINMAHGEFLILGAYALAALRSASVPFWLAFLVAPLVVAAIGFAAEALLIRFTYRRIADTILATWGLSLALRQGLALAFGPGAKAVAAPDLGAVMLFGGPYPVYRLVVMAISLTAIGVTVVVFFFTAFGLAARAAIADRDMAACLGIDTRRLDRITFSFGAGLAGLAGAAMAPLIAIDPSAELGWLVPAYLSILVGGVGSLSGPLAGAAAVGAADSFTAALTSPVVAQLVVFCLAIVVIRLFPNGLIARARREA